LPLIDEECVLPQGSDLRVFEKIKQKWGKSPYFGILKTSSSCFQVKHFAGCVTYDITNVLDKNRDLLFPDLEQVLLDSDNQFIANLIPISTKKTNQEISAKFRANLHSLMKTLKACNLYYIRCIKPNREKVNTKFDDNYAISQMRCVGMLETIKVRKMGFSTRMTFGEFCERYKILLPGNGAYMPFGEYGHITQQPVKVLPDAPNKVCEMLLQQISPPDSEAWRFGETKIFLRDAAVNILEAMKFRKEEEERKRKEEEERKRKEEEEKRKRAEEEKKRREEEERKIKEEEERKRKAEEERKRKQEEERKRKEEERKRIEEEERRIQQELFRIQREEEERKINQAEERKKQEEEAKKRKEHVERIRRIEEERRAAEAQERKKLEEAKKRKDELKGKIFEEFNRREENRASEEQKRKLEEKAHQEDMRKISETEEKARKVLEEEARMKSEEEVLRKKNLKG